MATIKLIKKIIYTGEIVLKTGLHIGGTNSALNIGGPDNFVVRNPINNIPYIPGSSLKGKLRALVEIAHGETNGGKPSNDPNGKSGALFGVGVNKENGGKSSRLIVRDAEMVIEGFDFSKTDMPYTETKTEVVIDRITGTSKNGGLRTIERVPAGAKFKLNMVLNIFEGEDEGNLKNTLKEAIELLQDDYLGGSGSRGYGQVEVVNYKASEKTVSDYANNH